MVIVQYENHPRKKLKGLLALAKSQATFSAPSINRCHCLKQELEVQTKSTSCNFFMKDFNIPDPILATAKFSKAGFAILQRHCQH